MSLRQQVEEMVRKDAEDEEWEIPLTQAQEAKRQTKILSGWSRMVMRTIFMWVAALKESVQERWIAAQPAPPALEMEAPKAKPRKTKGGGQTEKGRMKVVIGLPLPKSIVREYAVDPTVCPHPTPAMVAGGGRGDNYWWTCKHCGSRWQRLSEEEAAELEEGNSSKDGQPPPPPSKSTLTPVSACTASQVKSAPSFVPKPRTAVKEEPQEPRKTLGARAFAAAKLVKEEAELNHGKPAARRRLDDPMPQQA